MDQTQLNNLDPKLREAYQRVMGTTTPVSQTSTDQQSTELTLEDKPREPSLSPEIPSGSSTSINPSLQTANPPSQPEVMQASVKPVPETDPSMSEASMPSPSQNMFTGATPQIAGAGTQAYLAEEVAGAKQSLKMIQLLYIAGGIVFFVVYALFWMKFFQVTPSF